MRNPVCGYQDADRNYITKMTMKALSSCQWASGAIGQCVERRIYQIAQLIPYNQ